MNEPINLEALLEMARSVQASTEPEEFIPPPPKKPGPKPKPKPEPDPEAYERPVKRSKYIPSNPAGRGKGNIAKATVNRTVAFRSALDDEDWQDIAVTTFNRMMDPDCRNGDFVKLATFLARYNLVSADAQLVIDSENGSLTSDQIDLLRSYLKNDGMPSPMGKNSFVPKD